MNYGKLCNKISTFITTFYKLSYNISINNCKRQKEVIKLLEGRINYGGVILKRFQLKISVLALLAFTIILIGSLSLFDKIEASNSVVLKIVFFVLVYALIAIVLMYIYNEVDKKYDDVESSRRYYYYSKPYIIRIDKNGKIIKLNKTIEEKVLNYQEYLTIYDLENDCQDLDLLEEIFRQNAFTCKFELNTLETIYVRFLSVKIRGGFYLIGEDTTEQYNLNNFHRNMALYDQITKLPNKNYLGIKLQELFSDEVALKKKNTVICFDIVGFKNINKLFGYKIGDETINKIASIAQEELYRYKAQLFNIELDNFVVLFTGLNKYQDAIDWVSDFATKFDRAIEVSGNMFTISLKAGVFQIELDKYPGITSVDAYEYARLAHRKAKESRRFIYSVYDVTLGKHFSREQIMEVDLAGAIKKNEFVMNLQPQVNNETNKVVGFEALIRWNNPKYAYESPSTFIEIAERNNFIIDIGRYVIEETFSIAKKLEPYNIRVSINISPVQLLQTGFVHEIIGAFERHKLKRGSICIEITETFLMESLDEIIEKLTLIRNNGIIINLDNFGTGYSSMLYLKDLPIDGISINKEFIKGLNSDQYSRNIVTQIIKLAESLNLQVIAEGVEDQKQNQLLKEKGCNIIQGYLISKALPKEEAIKFMMEYNKS